jgi:PleD family two-component response regulator
MLHLRRFVPALNRDHAERQAVLAKAAREVEAGRRLVMYDRESGLLAHWYFVRRFEEEALRAERYVRSLSLMVVEIKDTEGFAVRDQVTEWLHQKTRGSDLSTHLGDGRYLVAIPETDAVTAGIMAGRLQEEYPRVVAVGLASFPEDGFVLGDLQAIAERRVIPPVSGARYEFPRYV